MKKNYIAPATTIYNVVEQNVIALSVDIQGATVVDDTELEIKAEDWNLWEE